MQTMLRAQPYDTSAIGFYFQSLEEYTTKSGTLLNAYGHKVEEFEIQFIDGELGELFNACGINQANIDVWFNPLKSLDQHEQIALFYLMSNGICKDLEQAFEKLDDVSFSECCLRDAAEELFDECYLHKAPEIVRNYIDYEAFARDCDLGGDFSEFVYRGTTYTCTNANSI